MRNSGCFVNFYKNGARKTVCLSDNEQARHGRDQMPVLRGIWMGKRDLGRGGAAQERCSSSPQHRCEGEGAHHGRRKILGEHSGFYSTFLQSQKIIIIFR